MEASLSVLADSGVGFEPPAPPTADHKDGKNEWSHDDGNCGPGAADNAATIQPSRGSAVNSGGGFSHSSGDVDSDRGRRGGQNEQHPAPGLVNDETNRVLHGVSAAVACRALPSQQQAASGNDERVAARDESQADACPGGSSRGAPQSERRRWEGDQGSHQTSHENERQTILETGHVSSAPVETEVGPDERRMDWSSTVDGDSGDDGRNRTRRQINQALHERALKRRHRCGDAIDLFGFVTWV